MENWIQGAIKKPGSFTRQAKKRKMSVAAFARSVKKNPEKYSKKTVKRANLAITLRKLGRKESGAGKPISKIGS